MIRKLIHPKQRLLFQTSKRHISDLINGVPFAQADPIKLDFSIKKRQIIKKSDGYEAKLHNLKVAAQLIHPILIQPNELFSFWKIVGNPVQNRGFQSGRTIINDVLTKSVGGGLCQISGIIYQLCIEADLEIVERHCHSLDLYNELTRYTPLGSDATVVYGYKDLRIKNNFDFPIRFQFEITPSHITFFLLSQQQIDKKEVLFKSFEIDDKYIGVTTYIDGKEVTKSTYRKFQD